MGMRLMPSYTALLQYYGIRLLLLLFIQARHSTRLPYCQDDLHTLSLLDRPGTPESGHIRGGPPLSSETVVQRCVSLVSFCSCSSTPWISSQTHDASSQKVAGHALHHVSDELQPTRTLRAASSVTYRGEAFLLFLLPADL